MEKLDNKCEIFNKGSNWIIMEESNNNSPSPVRRILN